VSLELDTMLERHYDNQIGEASHNVFNPLRHSLVLQSLVQAAPSTSHHYLVVAFFLRTISSVRNFFAYLSWLHLSCLPSQASLTELGRSGILGVGVYLVTLSFSFTKSIKYKNPSCTYISTTSCLYEPLSVRSGILELGPLEGNQGYWQSHT